ncbi:4-(cytidine 5'-diphospho)-2-C-methyl-D-erythritol kinase [Actinomyces minihominis]|uniref:4-(cytidine 5'-diphospho)-2-C-methyl-D-erythritol kinase n=1 Tax=Actinomyces minihominis TaxID=2002838 RepID=UPI000C06CB46|nr:4-(cytidine 5'-diphospho)-2-C-methyl-D-erythritol kinase [Actinomyces minihominis]
MKRVIASAPGKINLALFAGPLDSSGYHPLTTVFEGISLREYVVLAKTEGPGVGVETLLYRACSEFGNPLFDEEGTARFARMDTSRHLALRAAKLFDLDAPGLRITVHKTLPVAGGMAGGSADAAAALVAGNRLSGANLTPARLEEMARTLGADVPACLLGGVALGLGRGDHMELLRGGSQVPTAQSRWWVAVFSSTGLSTPDVFERFDQAPGRKPTRSLPSVVAGQSIDQGLKETLSAPGDGVKSALINDLQAPAFELRPDLAETARLLERAGVTWMMSGSGPTLVALADSRQLAKELARELEGLPGVSGTAVMWGPSEGARLEEDIPAWCRS